MKNQFKYIIGIGKDRRVALKRRVSSHRYIIGIDEVGRGALAGPVVVAAVALPQNYRLYNLRDSKKLSPKSREIWFKYVKEKPFILYAVARVYHKKIDSINISQAANLAAIKAFKRLIQNSKFKIQNCAIYLDGGLYLTNSKISAKGGRAPARLASQREAGRSHGKFCILKTIVKGDEKINAIKLASIVAKVTRDRYMIKLHKSYTCYGFDAHKGYGTKAHCKAIRKYGPSEVHRLTFIKKYLKMK